MDIKIPTFFRPFVFKTYALITGVNINEIDRQFIDFESLNEFFVRKLKPGVHVIDTSASLVSPSDGKIMGFGSVSISDTPIENVTIDHVKGFKFPLMQFLGEDCSNRLSNGNGLTNLVSKTLYYCSIYLAPADYHRFNSPTNWEITTLRRISGEQLPVIPFLLKTISSIYVLNERVPLIGKWTYGWFSLTAVGALNVGSVKIHEDSDGILLHSKNIVKPWCPSDILIPSNPIIKKIGDELGYFLMGSTIILIFEAPPNFKFCVKEGARVRLGQKLGDFQKEI